MKTNNIKNEEISAFSDGEIGDEHHDLLMQGLRRAKYRQAWDIYHQIGDVLRSDEMAHDCSAGFSAKLAARLALEPTYLAPVARLEHTEPVLTRTHELARHAAQRRFARPSRLVSGIAAGAAALYLGGTYLIRTTSDGAGAPAQVVAQAAMAPAFALLQAGGAQNASAGQIVMRDPRIDAYLIAHQQFSPSPYSTAQLARSASFANESAK